MANIKDIPNKVQCHAKEALQLFKMIHKGGDATFMRKVLTFLWPDGPPRDDMVGLANALHAKKYKYQPEYGPATLELDKELKSWMEFISMENFNLKQPQTRRLWFLSSSRYDRLNPPKVRKPRQPKAAAGKVTPELHSPEGPSSPLPKAAAAGKVTPELHSPEGPSSPLPKAAAARKVTPELHSPEGPSSPLPKAAAARKVTRESESPETLSTAQYVATDLCTSWLTPNNSPEPPPPGSPFVDEIVSIKRTLQEMEESDVDSGNPLQRSPPRIGFGNDAQNCYINAILAAICNTSPIFEFLLEEDIDHLEFCRVSEGHALNCITCILLSTLKAAQQAESRGMSSVVPWRMMSALELVDSALTYGRQEDAYGYWNHLQIAIINQYRLLNNLAADVPSPLEILLTFDQERKSECIHCARTSVANVETKSVLPLNVRRAISIADEIQREEKELVLDYECTICGKKGVNTTVSALQHGGHTPQVLIVRLERGNARRRVKLDLAISFNGLDYELGTAVVHRGSDGSGHYVAYCWRSSALYLHDDSVVTQIFRNPQELSTNAFLLFFVKVRPSANREQNRAIEGPQPKKKKLEEPNWFHMFEVLPIEGIEEEEQEKEIQEDVDEEIQEDDDDEEQENEDVFDFDLKKANYLYHFHNLPPTVKMDVLKNLECSSPGEGE